MLKKKEELVLKVLSDNSYKGEACLIGKEAIVEFCKNEKIVNLNNVEEIVKTLYVNDYIDVVLSNKKNERLYCVTILKKGKNYKHEKTKEINAIKNRILVAVICAFVSFIVGRILFAIFK